MNALHLCKLRKECLTGICHEAMVLTKHLLFLIFQLPKAEQWPLTIAHIWISCLIGNLKKQGGALILYSALRGRGAGKIGWKISAPLHSVKIYQMRPFLARSISLDSTYKPRHKSPSRKMPRNPNQGCFGQRTYPYWLLSGRYSLVWREDHPWRGFLSISPSGWFWWGPDNISLSAYLCWSRPFKAERYQSIDVWCGGQNSHSKFQTFTQVRRGLKYSRGGSKST